MFACKSLMLKKNADQARQNAESRTPKKKADQAAQTAANHDNNQRPKSEVQRNDEQAMQMADSRVWQKEAAEQQRGEENVCATEKLFEEETKKFENNCQNLSLSHCVCCWHDTEQ